ncbi:hypothetical protein SFRURICE_013322 [Spodoptera frugiperda]|nr:hypothetical protein SFRURICE_013322 [Spodoptera frugiperda]
MVPILFILGLTVVAALPNGIYLRRAPGPRYQHVQDGLGRLHLVDLWQPATDFNARYYPDTENVYHLFTRLNPSVSQPIVPGNEQLLKASNFDASRGAVARVISWINSVTGADLADYHIAGYSLGGQQAGLDPAGPGWVDFEHTFRATDAVYTEVMHTNVGSSGYLEPLAQVDFYPNGGDNMPGCVCYHYFAESIRDGGFTGVKCESYKHALVGDCHLPETLNMGGLEPKTGKTGVYYLETNAASPFSKG